VGATLFRRDSIRSALTTASKLLAASGCYLVKSMTATSGAFFLTDFNAVLGAGFLLVSFTDGDDLTVTSLQPDSLRASPLVAIDRGDLYRERSSAISFAASTADCASSIAGE
jgi:hypothetical protein